MPPEPGGLLNPQMYLSPTGAPLLSVTLPMTVPVLVPPWLNGCSHSSGLREVFSESKVLGLNVRSD